MARHAFKGTSFYKRVLAGISLVAVAAAPNLMVSSSSYGSDACDALDDGVNGATAVSLTGNVCQLTFTQTVELWSLPSQVTKLSVVAIGGGGGALSLDSHGYGGAGGQFNALDTVDLSSSHDFNITVGAAGANATTGFFANAGADTILKNVISGTPLTALVTAAGGLGGSVTNGLDASWAWRLDGIKQAYPQEPIYNNYANLDASIPGAGTAGNSQGTVYGGDGSGGAGKTISPEIGADAGGVDYLDPVLWNSDSAILGAGVSLLGFEFGAGGGITSTPKTTEIPMGQGAEVSSSGATVGTAGQGLLIMRFELPSSFTVTFDANGGSGSMSNQTASSTAALTTNSLTRSGFTFTGWNTAADGSGTNYLDGASFAFSVDDTLYAQWTSNSSSTPAPYTGPQLTTFSSRTLDPCKPTSITITGSRLSDAVPSIQGKAVKVLEQTATKLVLEFPEGLAPGNNVDLIINSSAGSLTHQDAFDIPAGVCATDLSKGRWTQLQSDGETVKMYAKDPVGAGKIQFFADGKEIAWVNAVDEADPKLSYASSNPYLVRSVELKPGKNRFEIKLDGVRVWRATYVLKG